jgi:hypothetical protein
MRGPTALDSLAPRVDDNMSKTRLLNWTCDPLRSGHPSRGDCLVPESVLQHD